MFERYELYAFLNALNFMEGQGVIPKEYEPLIDKLEAILNEE